MLDLRGVETFYWVAMLGGFRAASEKLHTSQPAISQRIRQLEQALDTRLFDRDARGMRLTMKGQLLLAHAESMLRLRQDMLRVARAGDAVGGRLTLGVAETIVQTWLPALLARVREVFPDLVLDIEVNTTPVLRAHLLARHLDLAFLLGPLDDPQVDNVYLRTYALAWVASPLLDLGPEPVPLAQLARWPVITYAPGSKPYQAVREMLTRPGHAAAPQMYGSASLSTTSQMMQDGLGVGVVAPVVLSREIAQGRLRVVSVSGAPLPELEFVASWLPGSDSHVAAAIARLAAEVAQATC